MAVIYCAVDLVQEPCPECGHEREIEREVMKCSKCHGLIPDPYLHMCPHCFVTLDGVNF